MGPPWRLIAGIPMGVHLQARAMRLATVGPDATVRATMRLFYLILALLTWPGILSAADLRPVIRREAGRCAAAWRQQDAEALLSFLPPRVVQKLGGRAPALKLIRTQFAQAGDYGVADMEAIPGQPAMPATVGPWLASLVPVTAVLHGPHVDITQSTHVLALSADQGRHWYLVLLYQVTQAELNAWFPEFKGRVPVPKDPEPRFEVVF